MLERVLSWFGRGKAAAKERADEEAHMSPYGAFITERDLPEHRDQKIISGAHQFPASNWTSRVLS